MDVKFNLLDDQIRQQSTKIQPMSDKIIKKNQFQIRKVPLKRFAPQKVPQLYALDIHSICLPKRQKKNIDWASIHFDAQKSYHQDYNDKIIYSQAYQQLYTKYTLMKQQRQNQKLTLQDQIQTINKKIQTQKQQKSRLTQMRDNYYNEIQNLRQELTECRNKSYNIRWQIYHQRGTYYMNVNNYSFIDHNDPTYEDYLLLEEQMGNVSRGLNQIQLALLPKTQYYPQPQSKLSKQNHNLTQQNPQNQSIKQINSSSKQIKQNSPQNSPQTNQQITKQICCICYDQINKGQYITILKCRHIHHCDCIKDWLAKQKYCPICKKQVVLDQFHLKKNQSINNYH